MATLERRGPGTFDFVMIDEARGPISIGSSPENDLVIDGDETVSRLHARLDRLGPGWCITDVGSRNGTTVNGKPVTSSKLFDGDEMILGNTRLVLRDLSARSDGGPTKPLRPLPRLTPSEKVVLVELCRPFLSELAFKQPASVKAIASKLVLVEGGIRQHLTNLYRKFGIDEHDEDKRLMLANAALQSGAVTRKDLEDVD